MKKKSIKNIAVIILIIINIISLIFIYKLHSQFNYAKGELYSTFVNRYGNTNYYLLNNDFNEMYMNFPPLFQLERMSAASLARANSRYTEFSAENSILYGYFSGLSYYLRSGGSLTDNDKKFIESMYEKRVEFYNEITKITDVINRKGINKERINNILNKYTELCKSIENENKDYLTESIEKFKKKS